MRMPNRPPPPAETPARATDSSKSADQPLELWGGIECSMVRVGDEVRDQLAHTGHRDRIDDLDRIAELGIRTLRFPILWEHHHAPDADWSETDRRLERLRALGIRPIVGFVHHGGGPLPGGLLDDDFVAGLADFARRVATRYPWIDAYTPVNEPLTTARFSGLYGLWHPHKADVPSFARAFMNELQATRAAMRAIREINPHARLVQTEDLGKTHSTPKLAYQAVWENERRWITFDLLCGRLSPGQAMWDYLAGAGITPDELRSFREDPCPPDIVGVNYYITSERFLDEHVNRYPPDFRGGNDFQRYADVAAVRVRTEGVVGLTGLLHELAGRYPDRTLAVTEIQLACTRDEQLRWLHENWKAAQRAKAEGVNIQALTVWSLLGAYDWDSLLLKPVGNYEPGVFDVRSPLPRPTVLARAVKSIATTGDFTHPALHSPGWWRRPVRLEHPPFSTRETGGGTALTDEPAQDGPAIVVIGAHGRLGRAFKRICHLRGLPVFLLTHEHVDITDADSVERALRHIQPWAVINATGYGRGELPEPDETRSLFEYATGAALLARACAKRGVRLMTFSTEDVFDGSKTSPYVESDHPSPVDAYGRGKLEAELRIGDEHPDSLIIRTSALFGPWDEANHITAILRRLAREGSVVATDRLVSPTYVPDLVHTALDLLIDDETGVWHLANSGEVTWADWLRQVATHAGFHSHRVHHGPPSLQPPGLAALGSERGLLLRSWREALARYFHETAAPNAAHAAA